MLMKSFQTSETSEKLAFGPDAAAEGEHVTAWLSHDRLCCSLSAVSTTQQQGKDMS